MSETLSRVEDILENIIGEAEHALSEPLSDTEVILQAILNDTEVTLIPRDRFDKLLLAIKNDTEYTGSVQTRAEDILYHILIGKEWEGDRDTLSRVEKLLLIWNGGSSEYERLSNLTWTSANSYTWNNLNSNYIWG